VTVSLDAPRGSLLFYIHLALGPHYSGKMVFDQKLGKAGDPDNHTTATESTVCPSDGEKIEPKLVEEGAYGEPDSDHEEVEQMNEGHLDDLVRQHVSCNL
jgi:hypothetical protein